MNNSSGKNIHYFDVCKVISAYALYISTVWLPAPLYFLLKKPSQSQPLHKEYNSFYVKTFH